MSIEMYSRAYTEVLEILKTIPQNEYDKIPSETIKFLEENKDEDYEFSIDFETPIEEQKISIEANSIIVALYRDYFVTEEQKESLDFILAHNESEQLKQINNKENEKYNFEIEYNYGKIENLPSEIKTGNFLKKIINYIKSLIFRK